MKLRDRIAAALLPDLEYASAYNPVEDPQVWADRLADAVIAELNIASPCVTRGCLLRLTALRHAQSSSALEAVAGTEER